MSISTCPRCREEFRVPSGAIPANAYAQCPWCHETFPVSEVLESLPPQLQIVSADGTPMAIGSAGSGLELVQSSSRQGGESAAGMVVHEARDDAFPLETSEQTTVEDQNWQPDFGSFQTTHEDPYSTWDQSDASPIQSMNVSKGNGRPKRKSSGLGTAIGIVLGGLASVPIAGGLLMLFGRTPDWGFWPFDGERVSVRAAAPLPENPPRSRTPSSSGTPLRFNRDQPELDASLDPSASAAQEILSTSLGDSEIEQATDMTAIVDSEPASGSEANDSIGASSDSPAAAPAVANSADDPALVSAADEAATKAAKMIEVISQSEVDQAELQRRLAITYQTIAKAAELAEPSGALLETLAAKIVDSPFAREIGSAGWDSLGAADRPNDGIALIGNYQGPAPDNAQQGALLTAESGQSVRLDSDSPLPADQAVLVLGRVVEEGTAVRVLHSQPLP